MRITTLVYLVGADFIWLGEKKTNLGAGKVNGFGGKKRVGETLGEAAVREVFEEVGVVIHADTLVKTGRIIFSWPRQSSNNQSCHIFIAKKWSGVPKETGEMKPFRVPLDAIPYERMWQADTIWFPIMLEGSIINSRIAWDSAAFPRTFEPFKVSVMGRWK